MHSLELFCVMCWGRGNEIKNNRDMEGSWDSILWLCQRVDNEYLENSFRERMTKCHSYLASLWPHEFVVVAGVG